MMDSLWIVVFVGFFAASLGLFLLFLDHLRLEHPIPDLPLAIFLAAVGVVVLVGLLATALAVLEIYSFGALTLGLGLSAGAGWAVGQARRRLQRVPPSPPLSPSHRRPTFPWGSWYEVGLVVLLLVGAWLYFRPHEYVLGGNDAGTYINTAVATAQTGSYIHYDPLTPLHYEFAGATLREQPAPQQTRFLQFVGWYLDSDAPHKLYPQFFPFHPMLLMVAVDLAGVWGALYLTPLWGVLGLAALYFWARRLFGRQIALAATLFLTVTPTQVYFARYPTTEPLTLLLILSGLLLFQTLWEERRPPLWWGMAAGAVFGAAMLTRIDLPLLLVLLGAASLLQIARGRWSRAWTGFCACLGICLVLLAYGIFQFNWPYFWNTYHAVYRLFVLPLSRLAPGIDPLILVGAIVAVGAVLLVPAFYWRKPLLTGGRALLHGRAFRWSAALCVVGLSAFAYFLRPVLEPVTYFTAWPGDHLVPQLNGQNWLRMGWYLTPVGLLLATWGAAQIFVRESSTRLWLVLAFGLLTTVQYVYNLLNAPYHIYAMRRYVPVVIPFLLLFAAYAAIYLPRLGLVQRLAQRLESTSGKRLKNVAGGLSVVVVIGLAGGLAFQSRYVLPQQDFAHSLAQLHELEQRLAPGSLLVFAEPGHALFADTFGPPLTHQFGHPVATIRQDSPEAAAFLQALTTWARERDLPVQLLAVEPIFPHVRQAVFLEPVDDFPFVTQMLMNTFDEFPSRIQPIHYGIEIYDVSTGLDSTPGTGEQARSLRVDVGAIDAAYIDGFWGKEYIPDAPPMRWTTGASTLTLPIPGGADSLAGPLSVSLRAMIYRPPGVEPRPVDVVVNGLYVGSFVPPEAWETFQFELESLPHAESLPSGEAELGAARPMITVELLTDPFVPAQVGFNNDTRELGFLLDWLKIEFDMDEN